MHSSVLSVYMPTPLIAHRVVNYDPFERSTRRAPVL
jgi:hypothetical protein